MDIFDEFRIGFDVLYLPYPPNVETALQSAFSSSAFSALVHSFLTPPFIVFTGIRPSDHAKCTRRMCSKGHHRRKSI